MPIPVSIGIIGGMGPWVDPLLLEKLLVYQSALGMRRDQEAIPLLLAQWAPLVEDRTEYLDKLCRGEAGENPAYGVARALDLLARAGARVFGIPCNTFHAPAIFGVFEHEIQPWRERGVTVVHMIRATCERVVSQWPAVRRVGILSTNGTYLHRIYAQPLAETGIEPVTLAYEARAFSLEEQAARRDAILAGKLEPLQNDVHHAIANAEWGIKSGCDAARGYPQPRALLRRAAERLGELGAEVLILGCTEIPLALQTEDVPGLPMIDPLDVLAQELVETWRRRFSPAWPAARELPFLPD
jgi:aspartate racemase